MRHRVLLRLVLFGVVLVVAAASAVASARSQLSAGAAAVSVFVAAPKPGPANGAPADATTWFAASTSAVQRMNLAQIARGNYSSVQGTWKSTGGIRISVRGNEMKIHVGSAGDITLRGLRVVQTDFANSANFGGYRAAAELARGQLVFYPGTLPHLFYLVFAPQGSSIKDWSGYTVPSKTSKPRIYIDGDPGGHATRDDGASHENSVMYNTELVNAQSTARPHACSVQRYHNSGRGWKSGTTRDPADESLKVTTYARGSDSCRPFPLRRWVLIASQVFTGEQNAGNLEKTGNGGSFSGPGFRGTWKHLETVQVPDTCGSGLPNAPLASTDYGWFSLRATDLNGTLLATATLKLRLAC
jgi:hypothetical protein